MNTIYLTCKIKKKTTSYQVASNFQRNEAPGKSSWHIWSPHFLPERLTARLKLSELCGRLHRSCRICSCLQLNQLWPKWYIFSPRFSPYVQDNILGIFFWLFTVEIMLHRNCLKSTQLISRVAAKLFKEEHFKKLCGFNGLIKRDHWVTAVG